MSALRSLGPSIVVEPFAAVVVASDELSSDKVCGRATVNQGWTGKLFFFTGRGREEQGQKSMGRGRAGNAPLPTVRGGEQTACTD